MGKTTVINMITGVHSFDTGDAFVEQLSAKTNMDKCRQSMGVCPQFDGLIDLLSSREHMQLVCRIRGVPKEERSDKIEKLIKDMDLSEKADAKTKTYSGGNKRKLSVALSLLADPKVVFLDEPSTGMDPNTRRVMWQFLSSQKLDRAIVLTTHSMEEADALCTEIGIMIRGRMRAEGTSQELKDDYGKGFQAFIRIGDETYAEAVDKLVESLDSEAYLLPSSTLVRKYSIPTTETNIETILNHIISNQDELNILDFSVTQPTLDEVFVGFANE